MNLKNESSLNRQITKPEIDKTVGGGTAGSVLASRLSEVEGIAVLLLEAGEEPNSKNVLEIPAMSSEHQRTFMDWSYKIEPQRHACQAFDNQVLLELTELGFREWFGIVISRYFAVFLKWGFTEYWVNST